MRPDKLTVIFDHSEDGNEARIQLKINFISDESCCGKNVSRNIDILVRLELFGMLLITVKARPALLVCSNIRYIYKKVCYSLLNQIHLDYTPVGILYLRDLIYRTFYFLARL